MSNAQTEKNRKAAAALAAANTPEKTAKVKKQTITQIAKKIMGISPLHELFVLQAIKKFTMDALSAEVKENDLVNWRVIAEDIDKELKAQGK